MDEEDRPVIGRAANGSRLCALGRAHIFSAGRRAATVLRYLLPTTQWGDWIYALIAYMFKLRCIPHVTAPRLFNDHLLRLKLSGTLSDPLRQLITDKEYAKHYVDSVVGAQHTLRTFAILRTDVEIDRFIVKDVPCVIKPTHLSGPLILFQRDREAPVDREEMKRWPRCEYYRRSREVNYRYLEHKVIVEEFFSRDGRTPPQDYKLFCFQGCPKLIQVDSNRFIRHTRNFYDMDWNRLPIMVEYPPGLENDQKPRQLDMMIEIAR